MNILLASSEIVPFAKTGGLADVCGALPIELAKQGHRPVAFMPAYRVTRRCTERIEPTDVDFVVPVGGKVVTGRLLRSELPGSSVPVYLVEQDNYFDREALYGESGADFEDNCERFVFFCRAVMESIRLLDLKVDVLHANDWQSGLLPAYLKTEYRDLPGYEHIASLMTIHNMGYQGTFWHWDMLLTGLDWKYFNWQQMEFHGNLNLLKTGIAFADSINTVSPRYAEEIQSEPLGWGLEAALTHRRDVLSGIINGVSYELWDPATDAHLAANFTPNDRSGKAVCKHALQQEMGLPEIADVPLVGLVGRLADQKGLDLIAHIIEQWAQSSDAQWAVLGTGEPKYHDLLGRLAERYPERIAAKLTFSDALAHRIEAGADMFLMPSRYEPCGLNQLYSLKYGTVPVVRATGGLADTIVDATPETIADRTATGFQFDDYTPPALDAALRRAYETYHRDSDAWARIVTTGMRQDWSWAASARRYGELYEKTVQRRYQPAGV